MATSTSFRISDAAKSRLAARAAHEGMTATALLDQLIVEGTDQLDYPGITFRGPAHDRRAALAAGPDVWEIIARLQELNGSEEKNQSCTPGSFASLLATPPSTPRRSASGSTVTGRWPVAATGLPSSVRHCWRDRVPD